MVKKFNNIKFSEATPNDLPDVISILANDVLGKHRENADALVKYQYAFDAITSDPNAQIIIVKINDEIIGVAQLNFIANLTYQGATRAQIEGVRIREDYQGQGIGKQLFNHLITLSKNHGCHLVQLTSNKSRKDAHDFYKKLGFDDSHEGFKMFI